MVQRDNSLASINAGDFNLRGLWAVDSVRAPDSCFLVRRLLYLC